MTMKIYKIGEICSSICSGGTPKSSEPSFYENGTIPWLTTSEVNFCNIYDTEKKITESGLKKSAAKYIPVNSVIVAMYGVTAGRSAINKIELTTNQACCNLQINHKIADYKYVYYYLMMQSEELNKLANGGAQQNLNSLIIKKYKIPLPDLAIQKKVSSILSNYDNLIENNNKRIKILEDMAENLYKEWFVRFRFPGYENVEFENGIPKGWVLSSDENNIQKPKDWYFGELNDIAFFVKGKNITSSEMIEGEIPVISAGLEPSGYHNKSNVLGQSITVSSSGANAGYLSYHLSDIWAADCSYYNNQENLWFVYNTLKFLQPVISNLQVGAAQPHVYAKNINKLSVIIPEEKYISMYCQKVESIYLEIKTLQDMNKNLKKQRDASLPKLMSGKIEV